MNIMGSKLDVRKIFVYGMTWFFWNMAIIEFEIE